MDSMSCNNVCASEVKKFCPVYKDLALYPEMAEFTKIAKLPSNVKRVVMIRMYDGDDFVPLVKRVCLEENIRSAFVTALGAMTKVIFAVYSLEKQRYENLVKEGYYEFTSVVGNVSSVLDENEKVVDIFVHVHINFADHEGKVYGGHLQPGAKAVALGEISVCEIDVPMYRYKKELDERGYSPLRFGVEVKEDLLPKCSINEIISDISKRKMIITSEDIHQALNKCNCTSINILKNSIITSEASDYCDKKNIKIKFI